MLLFTYHLFLFRFILDFLPNESRSICFLHSVLYLESQDLDEVLTAVALSTASLKEGGRGPVDLGSSALAFP